MAHCPGKEPSFWGGIDTNPKEKLAATYIEYLDNLAAFTEALNEIGEDEALKTIPPEFRDAYLDGKNMSKDVEPEPVLADEKDQYLAEIQAAVVKAQNDYADWYNRYQNGLDHENRGSEGVFSWFRHGKTGQDRAMQFMERINGYIKSAQAKGEINK